MKSLEELLVEAFNKGFKAAQVWRNPGSPELRFLPSLRDRPVQQARERAVRLIASRWSRHAEALRSVGKKPRQT